MHVLNKHKNDCTGSVYIGRGSLVGNPWSSLNDDGTREETIALFEGYFIERLKRVTNTNPIWSFLDKLNHESKLMCFCAPAACHGEIVAKYATTYLNTNSKEEFKMQLPQYPLDPYEDGISHINIYSRAATKLGKQLTNFAYSPFTHPEFGLFNSVEGFWYWLSTGCKHEKLRSLHGYDAKKFGSKLERVPREDFNERIKEAIKIKIESDPELFFSFIDSNLPFCHYYYWKPKDTSSNLPKVLEPQSVKWLTDYFLELRAQMKETHHLSMKENNG